MDNIIENISSGTDLVYLFEKLAIAVLIGFLIGIEMEARRRSGLRSFAGVRTFPMITTYGFISALIASDTDLLLYIPFFLIFGLLVSINYFFSAKEGKIGGTTEITFLLAFALGSLVYWEYLLLSAAVAILLTAFITLKAKFRSFAGKIGEEDIVAVLKFATITLIILPLLPDREFGPFDAFNPRHVWYMVVLISAISFAGYILFKLVAPEKGLRLLSLLGGIASSTALTLSFTQRSKEIDSASEYIASGIILASSIMFPRVLLILLVISPVLAQNLLLPVLIFSAVGIGASLFIQMGSHSLDKKSIALSNPFKVLAAIKFGILFAVILFISNAAQHYFGDEGLLFTSFFGGFADVDAVVLSMGELLGKNIPLNVAELGILLSFGSNTIVKMIISVFFGSKEIRKPSIIGFGSILLAITAYILIDYL